MTPRSNSLFRFAVVAAAAVAAASVWAQNRPEQGLLLDAQTWQEEVATAATGDWPADGWYRLVPQEQGVEVRAVTPAERATLAADALFFRLPGVALKTGMRPSYRHLEVLQPPRLGRDHVLSLGNGRFSLRVEDVPAGVQYVVGYGNQTYSYLLAPAGARTAVQAVADVDGDGQPDFVVATEDSIFLLLSTQAQPGPNLPTAELAAQGC
jgi:hypothetical protein